MNAKTRWNVDLRWTKIEAKIRNLYLNREFCNNLPGVPTPIVSPSETS